MESCVVFLRVLCVLSFVLCVAKTESAAGEDGTGVHLVTLLDEESESKELEAQLLHSACRLNYTNVKILREWCPSGDCKEDLRRLEDHLKSLPEDDWAIIINPSNEYVYLMATPERAKQKLKESGKRIIVAVQPEDKEKKEGESDKEEKEKDNPKDEDKDRKKNEDKEKDKVMGEEMENKEVGENEINIDQDNLEDKVLENPPEEETRSGTKEGGNTILKALAGGSILGRVGSILQSLKEGEISEEDLMIDTSAQHILFGNRLQGGLAMQVPIEAKFIPEGAGEGESTSPFVIFTIEGMLDFYNLIHFGGEGPQYCPYTKEQPLVQDEVQPRILVSLDVSGAWVPFLEEVLQGVLMQDYPKERMDIWIHAKSRVQENEIEQFKENGKTYSSFVVVEDESVDTPSIRSKCAELSCDYALVMDPQVLLEEPQTLSELISSNRPVVGPLLSEMRSKQAKPNFVYSSDGGAQWQELIEKRTVKGTFRVKKIRNLVLYRSDALRDIDTGRKMMEHYINNDRKGGYLLDPRGYQEGKVHPDLWGIKYNKFMWIRRYLHPEVLQVIKKEKKPEELGPYLYYMPFYTERLCKDMIEEMENYGHWYDKEKDDREEAAHQYSSRNINFEEIGYAVDYHLVLNSVHKELLSALYDYRGVAEASLIFVLKYASAANYGTFNYHLDGASYTFNIALNNDFTGGGLLFKMGNHFFNDEIEFAVPHNRTGWAVIQPNRPLHIHKGVPLESGTRYAMINIIDTNDEAAKGGPVWIE